MDVGHGGIFHVADLDHRGVVSTQVQHATKRSNSETRITATSQGRAILFAYSAIVVAKLVSISAYLGGYSRDESCGLSPSSSLGRYCRSSFTGCTAQTKERRGSDRECRSR